MATWFGVLGWSAVNVSFAPKPTHLSFLKRWLILVLGCSLFLLAFFCNLTTECNPRFETFEIFDFNLQQHLLWGNYFFFKPLKLTCILI